MNNNKVERYFYSLIEWLEKYIEKAGYFSDWEKRKQIQNNSIGREDMNGSEKKDEVGLFAGAIYFLAIWKDAPLKPEKDQLYKWIDATKINAENCPDRLKLILYAMNEIIEERKEKFEHDFKNAKRDLEPDSPEYQKMLAEIFSKIPSYQGRELPMGEFSGDPVRGKKIFQEIIDTVSPTDYENFHWVPQKEETPLDDSLSAQNAIQELQKILAEIKKIDENKDSGQAEIEQAIQKLTEFKNNSAAHEGKNGYAWRKLNGSSKLSSLITSLKMRDFRAKNGKDNKSVKETNNNTTKYWIIGISIIVLFLLGLVVLIKKKKINWQSIFSWKSKNQKKPKISL